MKPTDIHIGKAIAEVLKKSGMKKSELARRIETSPQNLYGILKRQSLDSALLHTIGTVLNHNFFALYKGKDYLEAGERERYEDTVRFHKMNTGRLQAKINLLEELLTLYRQREKEQQTTKKKKS